MHCFASVMGTVVTPVPLLIHTDLGDLPIVGELSASVEPGDLVCLRCDVEACDGCIQLTNAHLLDHVAAENHARTP